MGFSVFPKLIYLVFIYFYTTSTDAAPPNKTAHHVHKVTEDSAYNDQKSSYRSFQPVLKHKTIYPRHDDRDYDITSYDSEYGGVVSNFTSSIYDDNPQLYPNPEFVARNNLVNKGVPEKIDDADMPELPDDSLADADLKEHNIIDSVTYLYGFKNCHGVRNEWVMLIYIACAIATFMQAGTGFWIVLNPSNIKSHMSSKLSTIHINIVGCLFVNTQIYIQAMDQSPPDVCMRIALTVHYLHLACAMWILIFAAAVTEYSISETFLPLHYSFMLAYGIPAIVVMFNYALSLEQYEIKHYCWMSIEKGMVMGFMIPSMILILINTAIVIVGLRSVNKMQAEILSTKIQQLVDHQFNQINNANWTNGENMGENNVSIETLDVCTPGSSRNYNDSSENLDRDNDLSEDECTQYPNNMENGTEPTGRPKYNSDKSTPSLLYLDFPWNLSWMKEGNMLKSYLNMCLVLQPFFAINWVMGVVALENAQHWTTPAIYLVLIIIMYVYFAAVTVCTTFPKLKAKNKAPAAAAARCDGVLVSETIITRTRYTDSIPLLDPASQQAVVTPAPADAISTISI